MNLAKEHTLKRSITQNLYGHGISDLRNNLKKEILLEKYGSVYLPQKQNRKTDKLNNKFKTKYTDVLIHLTMIKNLYNHNSNRVQYFTKIINDLLYDEKKHMVCNFKDYLLWDENSDFLKRFYESFESKERIPKISQYYEQFSLMRPVYFHLACNKIMLKNVRKHQRYLELIEANNGGPPEVMGEIENEKVHYSKVIKTTFLNTDNSCKDNSLLVSENNTKINKELNFFKTSQSFFFTDTNLYICKPGLNLSYSEILDENNDTPNNNYSIYFQIKKLEENSQLIDKNVHNLYKDKQKVIETGFCNFRYSTHHQVINNNMFQLLNVLRKTDHKKEKVKKSQSKEKLTFEIPLRKPAEDLKKNKQFNRNFRKIEFKLDLKNLGSLKQMNYDSKSHSSTRRLTSVNNRKSKNKKNKILKKMNSIYKSNESNAKINNFHNNIETNDSKISKTLFRFKTKNIINTDNIKKRLNIVENMLKTLRETSDKKNINTGNLKMNKSKLHKTQRSAEHKKLETIRNNRISNKKLVKSSANKVIKTNIKIAQPIFNNHNNILNNYILQNSNLANHIKTISHTEISNKKQKSNQSKTKSNNTKSNTNTNKNSYYNTNPSSIYNINFNLNLNVNFNSINTNSILKENPNELTEREIKIPQTDRLNYINKKESDQIFKKEKAALVHLKSNEKYKNLSRNLNIKNFIFNNRSDNKPGGEVSNNLQNVKINSDNKPVFKKKKPKNLILTNCNNSNKEFLHIKQNENKTFKIKNNFLSNHPVTLLNLDFGYKNYITNFFTNNSNESLNCKSVVYTNEHDIQNQHSSGINYSSYYIKKSSKTNINMKTHTSNKTKIFKPSIKNNFNSQKKPLSIKLKNLLEIETKYPLTSRDDKQNQTMKISKILNMHK